MTSNSQIKGGWLTTPRKIFALKSLIHIVSLWVVISLYYRAINDTLGSDPVKAVIHITGGDALKLMLLTLLVSPLAKKLKAGWLMQTRRLLGLYCFFYACLHLASYALFELQLDLSLLGEEIVKRPYIMVGMAAFILLTLLAITSPNRMRRKLGTRWQKLHNYVYLAAMLIIVHFYWSVKSDITEPLIYGALLAILLVFRRSKLTRFFSRRS